MKRVMPRQRGSADPACGMTVIRIPFFPHISPALPGSGARRARSNRSHGWMGRGGHVQQCAQVDKVELITGALVERVVTSLFDKLLGVICSAPVLELEHGAMRSARCKAAMAVGRLANRKSHRRPQGHHLCIGGTSFLCAMCPPAQSHLSSSCIVTRTRRKS